MESNDRLQRRIAQLERENQDLVTVNDELNRKCANAKKAQRETQDILDARTTELKEAQEYLSMTDDIPDTEIVHIVQALNASIFQVAAAIVDDPRLSCSTRRIGRRGAPPPEGINLMLFNIASSSDSDGLPTVVQVALQAEIARLTKRLASTWDFYSTKDGDRLLSDLYRRIRSLGAPLIHVKARWFLNAKSRTPFCGVEMESACSLTSPFEETYCTFETKIP